MTTSIEDFLQELGLDRYGTLFARHEIDLDALRLLCEHDLAELGVALGPRKKILAALQSGQDIASHAAQSRAHEEAATLSAERRQLTVLFCDLVGSTALSQRLDPEALRDLIGSYHSTCRTVVEKYAGHVAQYLGDGVMAYFGWPQAHEDDAERALRAGLDLVNVVKSLTVPEAAGSDPGVRPRGDGLERHMLSVRIGVATGPVVVGEGGEHSHPGDGAGVTKLAVGETPNLAARLQGLAGPDEIVMSTVTRRLAGAVFEVRDLGSHLLKGIVEPVSAWQVVGLKGAEGRFEATRGGEQRLSAFVGREDELRLLASKWAQVREGEGQVVLLEGEPGIGKSRITQWLMADIGRERHYRLRYQCSPFHTQSAFHPVIEQIERAAGFCIDDPSDVRLDKLEALFGESRRQPSQTVALVGALLGVPGDVRYGSLNLTPQKQKQLTLKALTDHVVASATDAPVLLLLEDAHWVDPSTLESLALTVEAAKGARILVLITYRPEFKAPWTGDRHVSNVILQRLSTRQTRLLAESIAGERQLPDEIVEQIVQRTDGIPLFVEEMTKAVLESGLLKLDGSGRYRSNGSLGAIAVPTTLRDSLTARLDRLSPSKEVAQISACIGREFRYALLETVSGLPRHQLADALLRLESSELVLRHGEPPESVYTFKHALIQDAAYEGLIKGRRTQIHARIAEVLEADFPELAMAEPETLARHWTLADRPAQSVVYWLAAGEKAIRRVAFQEALRHLDCGIEAIRSSPPSRVRDDLEVALRAALAMAWMAHRGWQAEQVTAAATPALPLLKGSDRREARMRILVALRHNSMNRGRIREAAEWYRRMLEIGEQDDDAELLLEGHVGSMSVNYWLGEFAKSESSAAEVRSRYHPEQHWHVADVCNHDPLTLYGIWMSQCLWIRGFADQALKLCNEKDVHATRRNHPFDLGFALTAGALALDFARRPEEMLARVLQAKALGEEQSLPVISRVLAPLVEGLACLRSGQPREARGLLSRSMDAWTGGGAYIATPYIRAALAEAFALEGDNEEGLRLVEESIEQSDRAGWEERAHAAELIRIKGWILWRTARLDAAEVAYREALHMARRQGALSWELRGATQLAELLADTRRQAVARETLEPVLVRVVEGWDSPDVVRARAVLESVR